MMAHLSQADRLRFTGDLLALAGSALLVMLCGAVILALISLLAGRRP